MAYKIVEESEGRCLECGETIHYGSRTDRKFCCDKCKDSYHNKCKVKDRKHIQRTNRLLEKNHKILRTLNANGIKEIEINELKVLGYSMDYVTSYSKAGYKTVLCCYDMQFFFSGSKMKNLTKLRCFPFESSKSQKD